MSYKELLERARGQLPEKVFEKSRFEIPKISSVVEGNKTFIVNIRDVLTGIDREANHLHYMIKPIFNYRYLEENFFG